MTSSKLIKNHKSNGCDLVKIVTSYLQNDLATLEVAEEFSNRLKNPKLLRDDGELTHFCVFFAAIDKQLQEVFIGHHIKSGRWIPNGGHIDNDETPIEALSREISEEWGISIDNLAEAEPCFMNFTDIENPAQWSKCTRHYNIWYFIEVDKNNFRPDPKLIAEEFYEIKWVDLDTAKKLTGNIPSVIEGYDLLGKKYFKEVKKNEK